MHLDDRRISISLATLEFFAEAGERDAEAIRPARFAVPTVAGLCRALDIAPPMDDNLAAATLRAIADKLGISERTVNAHIERAIRKCGAKNRQEAVARLRAYREQEAESLRLFDQRAACTTSSG